MLAAAAIHCRRGLPRLNPALSRELHGPGRPQEHTETPQYPPIRVKQKFQESKDFMASLRTVEEKQYQLNRPKAHGWYSYILNQDYAPMGSLEFLQFATQTHLVPRTAPGVVAGLPEYFGEDSERVDRLVEQLGPKVEQVILNDKLYSQHGLEVENDRLKFRDRQAVNWEGGSEYLWEKRRSEGLVRALHQTVSRHLQSSSTHLTNCSEDFGSRNEAFWFRGGIGPDKSMIKKREGVAKKDKDNRQKGFVKRAWGPQGVNPDLIDDTGRLRHAVLGEDKVMEPYERALQFMGRNTVQLRSSEPLPEWVARDDDLATTSHVPWVPHDPREYQFKTACQNGTNVPGYWPDEENGHGMLLLSHRVNNYLQQAKATPGVITEEVVREGNTARALMSCFGWMLPQACYLGFSPMTELTFPLATQACLTDGRVWTHYAFQLNTVDLGLATKEEHTHNNLLWVGDDQVLYDSIEDGRLVGFNPSALAPLVRQYLRQPQSRSYSMTPYLGAQGRLSQYHDSYQRQFLMGNHRTMYSKRPVTGKHGVDAIKPEIYMWEKMHLIDHPSAFEKNLGLRRRRWFQMYKVDQHGKQHWHPEFQQYDEGQHRYIPKWFREPYQRKSGSTSRRDSRRAAKVTVPLQDQGVSVYQMPDIRYNKKKPLLGYAWKNTQDQGPGFS